MIPPPPTVFDITLPIRPGMPVWPGDPEVEVEPVARITSGDAANVSRIGLSSHTGTHVDAPWHALDDGPTVSEIPIERWVGPCLVVELLAGIPAIEPHQLDAAAVPPGTTRLILKTGYPPPLGPGAAFDPGFPALSADAARWVRDRGMTLVGIDTPSIEACDSSTLEAHRVLLRAGIVVVEGLDLRAVDPGPYTLVCLPLKILGGDGAPARVLLVRDA